MSDAENICLACGLCCDGTLIGFVQLDADEITDINKIMDIEVVNDNGFFLHPCKKYCNGCTIYAQRPKNCDRFKCELLHTVDQKTLSFNSAVDVVSIIKQKKIAIEQKLATLNIELQSGSFYFKMVELKKLLQNNKSHQELASDLKELDLILSDKFGVTLD